MRDETIKIGIIGHRQLEDPVLIKKQLSNYLLEFRQRPGVIIEAYSSIAAGTDTLFAEATVDLGIPLYIILPFRKEIYEQDFISDTRETVNTFNRLLKNGQIKTLHEEVLVSDEQKSDLYRDAAKEVIDTCDVIIAVWDGENERGVGGTGESVKYVREQGKQLIHIKAFRSDISRVFSDRDKKAIGYKKKYETLWKSGLGFGLLSALILTATISFHIESAFVSCLEVIFVLLALVFASIIRLKGLKEKRLISRREAERLRVLGLFYNSNIPIEKIEGFKGRTDEIKNIEEKYSGRLTKVVNIKRSQLKLLELVEAQITYHTKDRAELKDKVFIILEAVKFPLFVLFLAGVLYHFLTNDLLISLSKEWPHWPGLLFSLAIPPLYAAIESYIGFKEYYKISYDSENMKMFFENMRSLIIAVDTRNDPDAQAKINNYGARVRSMMDDENRSWSVLVEHHDLLRP